jgi:hypothetical protein
MYSIYFSGIDGAGKTTQAKIITATLKKYNLRVHRMWFRTRGMSFISLPLLLISKILHLTRYHTIDGGIQVAEYQFFRSKLFSILWLIAQLCDLLVMMAAISVVLKILDNEIIVVDRGPLDCYVDLVVDIKLSNSEVKMILQRLYRRVTIGKPFFVYIYINADDAKKRKYDLSPNIDYLLDRLATYEEALSSFLPHVLVNGLASPTDIHHQIMTCWVNEVGRNLILEGKNGNDWASS